MRRSMPVQRRSLARRSTSDEALAERVGSMCAMLVWMILGIDLACEVRLASLG